MARRTIGERTIFFPWERRVGLWRRLGSGRAGPLLVLAVFVALLLALGARERTRAGVRATRATLVTARAAVDAFRADHEGRCPGALAELVAGGYLTAPPADAWGRPLRLVCPGRNHEGGFDLLSDGPDGEVGGLDRIE